MNAEEVLNLTIAEITEGYYLPEKTRRRRANTVEGYMSSIYRHMLPQWGERTLGDITRDEVQDWVDELAQTDAGPGGAWKAFKCLRQIFNWAIDKWGLFIAVPTRGVEEPRARVYRFETLTQRRLKRLIRGFVGHRYEATLIIQASLGVRFGENCFLRWESINWRTGAVQILGTLQQVKGRVIEYPTKTVKSERELYLPPWALDRLHDLWILAGRPKGRIIGDAKPKQVAYHIKQHIKRNKLPYITMKNLRHTWATIAIAAGVAIETVASMMGHSSIQTCYKYYYALTKATQRRAQRKVARSIIGKTCEDIYKGITLNRPATEALPMAA